MYNTYCSFKIVYFITKKPHSILEDFFGIEKILIFINNRRNLDL